MRRGIGGVLCAAVMATAIGACGSGSGSSSQSAASSPSAQSSGVKGPAFKVGMICSCTGPQAASLGAAADAMKVWASSVNNAGGIDGHPVDLITADDGGDPATSLQAVKKMVESDKIQALVGDISNGDSGWADYITKAGIPVIGGSPVLPIFITNPNFVAEGSTLPVNFAAEAGLAASGGGKHFGLMYCAESPLCAQAVPLANGTSTAAGLKFTAEKVAATAPSYTAPCLSMKGAGVDVLHLAVTATTVPRVAAACVQQGYKPTLINNVAGVTSDWLKDPNLQGMIVVSGNALYTDQSNPAVVTFRNAVKKYDSGLLNSPLLTEATLWEWTAGKMFEEVVKAGKLTPDSTPKDVSAAIPKITGTTLGGLSGPLPVSAGKPVFSPCNFAGTIKNGGITPLGGGKPICLSKAQMAGLLKALQG